MSWPPLVKARKIRKTPYVPGTWVTGSNLNGLSGFPMDHQGHIFVVDGPYERSKISNAGYHQPARCLRCGVRWRRVDGEFLQVRADHEYIETELLAIEASISRMTRVRAIIGKELTT